MRTTSIGQQAESAVAGFLNNDGYQILVRNWKTKICEIDIVAKKGQIVYFIEVKYRASLSQGSGFEYIGPQKLNRLRFAARVWSQQYNWDGDYRIIGAEVTGINHENIELVEIE